MPPEATVRRWAMNDEGPGFLAQYASARSIGLDCLADRLLEVAETPVVAEKRVQKPDGGIEITTGDAVDRSRLTVDAIKWQLSKMRPDKYGDRTALEHSGPGGAPLSVTVEFVRSKVGE